MKENKLKNLSKLETQSSNKWKEFNKNLLMNKIIKNRRLPRLKRNKNKKINNSNLWQT